MTGSDESARAGRGARHPDNLWAAPEFAQPDMVVTGERVRLPAYRREWSEQFEAAASAIGACLGALLTGPVVHVGSTAVPGMIAKPQIDMVAPVAELAAGQAAAVPLIDLGYVSLPHRTDAVLYVEPGSAAGSTDQVYRHSLHLTTCTSDLWTERILFRDALRASPALRAAYISLKLRMLAGPEPYRSRDKRNFVRQVLAAEGHRLRDGLYVVGGADGRAGG